MQQKYPIINTTLLSLSSIDPCALGHTTTQKYLKKLGNLFPQILDSDELVDGYVTDISKINLDKELPPAMITKDDESVCPVELDDWWIRAIFIIGKYPVLTLVVKACLSIFSGPLVKGSKVKKFGCIGHVQKRMGKRLRTIRKTIKGLGGSGRLTDVMIDKIQNYYGIAIRGNTGKDCDNVESHLGCIFSCCLIQQQGVAWSLSTWTR